MFYWISYLLSKNKKQKTKISYKIFILKKMKTFLFKQCKRQCWKSNILHINNKKQKFIYKMQIKLRKRKKNGHLIVQIFIDEKPQKILSVVSINIFLVRLIRMVENLSLFFIVTQTQLSQIVHALIVHSMRQNLLQSARVRTTADSTHCATVRYAKVLRIACLSCEHEPYKHQRTDENENIIGIHFFPRVFLFVESNRF